MKQIGCLLLLATALLIGVGGCNSLNPDTQYGYSFSIEVDGERWQADCEVLIDKQEQIVLTFFTLVLNRTAYVVMSRSSATNIEMSFPDGEKVVAKTETFYFIDDGKISFEKTYQELGIDISKINLRRDKATLDYLAQHLTPILETLIREHLKPQEPEMEEQR